MTALSSSSLVHQPEAIHSRVLWRFAIGARTFLWEITFRLGNHPEKITEIGNQMPKPPNIKAEPESRSCQKKNLYPKNLARNTATPECQCQNVRTLNSTAMFLHLITTNLMSSKNKPQCEQHSVSSVIRIKLTLNIKRKLEK